MPSVRDIKNLCPRCKKKEVGEIPSTTDGATLICNTCATSEKVYNSIKDRANQLTVDSWGYEQSRWPVKQTNITTWRSIDFKDFE